LLFDDKVCVFEMIDGAEHTLANHDALIGGQQLFPK